MAYAFDVFVLVLIATSPFFLAVISRVGPGYRIISGLTAILIGLFLIIAFWFSSFIDWKAHWLLANILEFISLALLPISLVLFAVAPVLYIGFGIRALIKNRVGPIPNESSQARRRVSRITKNLSFGIIVLLLGIYLTFNWFVSLGGTTMGAHQEHINYGEQAYRERNYPEAEKQFLAALKEAEDFGQGGLLISWISRVFGSHPTQTGVPIPSIKDNLLGVSLERLAEVYETQGQYEKAEPLLKRNLAIAEKGLGPDSPLLAKPLEKYAALLHKMNRENEAASLEGRIMAIRLKQAQ